MTTRRLVSTLTVLSLSAWRGYAAGTFDISRPDNLAVYWGQGSQDLLTPLSDLCKNDDVTVIPLAFMTSMGADGMPEVNLSNYCSTTFEGSTLLDCSQLAADISACQSAGKIVTLSIGGATGGVQFASEDAAKKFAETFYNTFLGGNSSTRTFGSAVLDGFDLDIEGGGTKYYSTFVNHTLAYAKQQNDKKKYYVTGAPQCPCMDQNMGEVLGDAPFDALFVQFYNNGCGMSDGAISSSFNYNQWDEWARTASINKDVKIYIGAPASQTAGAGFVAAATIGKYAELYTKNNTASFGGVMLWDAYHAAKNPGYIQAVKQALTEGGGGANASTSDAPHSSGSSSMSAAPVSTTTDGSTSTSTGSTSVGSASSAAAATSDRSTATMSGATTGEADGPAATLSGADGTQTTSQTSTPTGSPGDDGDDDSDCDDEDEDGDESSQAAGPTATSTSDAPASMCTPAPSDCAGVPDWEKTQAYNACESVRYKGKLYQASSWVTSNEPGSIDVWKLGGACPESSGGSSADSSSTVLTAESGATSATVSSPASVTGSPALSSTDPSALSSTDSAGLTPTDSSALSPTGSSTVSSAGSSMTSSAGSSLSSSQSVTSSVQPERRLFGMRARHVV